MSGWVWTAGEHAHVFLRMAWRPIAWHGAALQTGQHDIKRSMRRSGTPLLNPSAPPHLHSDADEVDFDGFLRMLRVGSYDSLDALDQVRPVWLCCQGCPAPDGGRPGSKLFLCPAHTTVRRAVWRQPARPLVHRHGGQPVSHLLCESPIGLLGLSSTLCMTGVISCTCAMLIEYQVHHPLCSSLACDSWCCAGTAWRLRVCPRKRLGPPPQPRHAAPRQQRLCDGACRLCSHTLHTQSAPHTYSWPKEARETVGLLTPCYAQFFDCTLLCMQIGVEEDDT